jgi:hypothetical protein
MELFIFVFSFFLSRILYNVTFFFRYALFLLGFCSFISFKNFLSCLFIFYLRDGSTPTSPAPGLSFFESISDSLLHICYSQIVQATTDPILTATKGFLHELPAFLACRPFGHLLFIFFLGFCLFFQRLFNLFPSFISGAL